MTPEDREAALGRLQDFLGAERSQRAQNSDAVAEIDLDSLSRARDLSDLYEDRSWVQDLPFPKGKGRKKRLKPDSQERFAQWLKLKEVSLSRQRVSQLLEALVIAESCNLVARFTERACRPIFGWTGREGQGSPADTPRLIARASELAGTGRVTSKHVSDAIAELRKEREKAMGPVSVEGQRATRAELTRQRMEREAAELRETDEGKRELLAFVRKQLRLLEAAAKEDAA